MMVNIKCATIIQNGLKSCAVIAIARADSPQGKASNRSADPGQPRIITVPNRSRKHFFTKRTELRIGKTRLDGIKALKPQIENRTSSPNPSAVPQRQVQVIDCVGQVAGRVEGRMGKKTGHLVAIKTRSPENDSSRWRIIAPECPRAW